MPSKTHIMHGRDHVASGADPIPGMPPPLSDDTLDSAILALDPGGFWKLDEASGTVAHDSSGNSLDLTVAATGDPVAWAQTAGPPGTQSARFNTHNRAARAWASFATGASFTAGLWYRWNANFSQMLIGQGIPERSGAKGWMLEQYSSSNVTAHGGSRAAFRVAGTSAGYVDAVNASTVGGWKFIVGVYDYTGPTMKLYIDGVLQGSASAAGYVPYTASPDLWVGFDSSTSFPNGTGGSNTFDGSYAFLYPVALTGPQILDIYNHAGSSGFTAAGLVLTSNGFGGSTWSPPTIEVQY